MIKFLEVKRAYYADPENVRVEYWNGNAWGRCGGEPRWSHGLDYRIRPRTIRIGDIDVPEPVREAPETGTEYFVPAPSMDEYCVRWFWKGGTSNKRHLSRGRTHLVKENAVAYAKAEILVSGGKIDD